MGREALGFQLSQGDAEPARVASAGIAIDQAAELRHGTARIGQMMLVEIHQRQADAKVITCRERMGARVRRARPRRFPRCRAIRPADLRA